MTSRRSTNVLLGIIALLLGVIAVRLGSRPFHRGGRRPGVHGGEWRGRLLQALLLRGRLQVRSAACGY